MIRVYWQDGSILEARTYGWLLRRLAREPWNEPYTTGRAMRNELARRAYVWSGDIVDPRLPAPEFWQALDRTGLVTLDGGRGIHTALAA